MIVAPLGSRLLVVTQNDHAHFSGEMLALWRADGLPDHPEREALLFAAREHDNGWAEIDSAPMSHSETGRPLDFMAISRQTRWRIWRLGTLRHTEREPYGALLIVRHALHLHRSQLSDPEWSDVFDEWRQLEEELMEATGASKLDVARDYRWIELTDLLSLAACSRWRREIDLHGYRATWRSADDVEEPSGEIVPRGTLHIDPFPLAGATTFRIACRVIPDRRFAGDADLGIELATARWNDYAVRIAPLMSTGV